MNREGYKYNVSWYCRQTGLTESVMCESRAEMDAMTEALMFIGIKRESIYYELVEVPPVDPYGLLATRRALSDTPNITSLQKGMLERAIERIEAQIKASLGDRLYADVNDRQKSQPPSVPMPTMADLLEHQIRFGWSGLPPDFLASLPTQDENKS